MGKEQLTELRKRSAEKTKYLLELAKDENYEVCVWGAGFLGKGFGRQILDDYGIQIDYYCDNNQALHGTEIQGGIYCCDSARLVENSLNTICFLLINCGVLANVYRQLVEMGIKYIVTYEDLLNLNETIENYFAFMNKKQVAIYTCITGGYDELIEPDNVLDNCDYYLLSDKKPTHETVYKFIDVNSVVPNYITDDIQKNRYCKMHPHKFLDEYKYSIYIDGNITLKGNITECIPQLRNSRIGTAGRMYINSVYAEALRHLKNGRDDPKVFSKQLKKYWFQGMPSDFGIFWCAVLIREHNNPVCIKLMNDWWEEFINNSRRDQVSFSYVLWRNGYTAEDVFTVCGEEHFDMIDESPYWEIMHNHKKERFNSWLKEGMEYHP